jgi:hypothetical protein
MQKYFLKTWSYIIHTNIENMVIYIIIYINTIIYIKKLISPYPINSDVNNYPANLFIKLEILLFPYKPLNA